MRTAYVKTMCELGKKDERIFCLVADIGEYLLKDFKSDFPGRFYNMGIAEANMIGVAAGLALCGKIPFVYTITPFVTGRCYDQIKVDLCYQNLNVNIIGVGCGFSYGTSGPSHHAILDIAIMRVLPKMAVLVPSDPIEAAQAVEKAVSYNGPTYIRMGLTGEPVIHSENYSFEIGKAEILRKGEDIAIIGCGSIINNALLAADTLREKGINPWVINMPTIKPIDKQTIAELSKNLKAIITIEEHSVIGGLGSAVSEVLVQLKHHDVVMRSLGVDDVFCCDYGSREYLYEKHGLTSADIVALAREMMN